MASVYEDFYKYLRNLGVDDDDAKAGARKHESAMESLRKTAAKASSSSSTSSSGGSIAGMISAGLIDQQANKIARISTETGGKIIDAIKNSASLNPLKILAGVMDAGISGATALIGDIAKLDQELIERVRGAGGYVGGVADVMKDSTREAMITAQQFGVSTNDTLDAVKSLMENGERMAVFSDQTISSGMVASLAFTKNSTTILENAENFRNVGIGLGDATKAITEAGMKSVSVGLSAKATSETLIKQLSRLNEFGFQNGVKGLGRMVQEAQALKINMDEIFRVATDLYDPDKAINLAANLQVVGGAVGDLGDPIKLMYDATNNVESLQTSIIGAARSLATYNAEQGRFEVTGVNLRRAKAMADAMGISMGELTNMAIKGASKMEAMSELDMFPSLSDDQKEFVSNIATIKDGQIGFDIPKNMVEQMGLTNVQDGFVSLSSLSDKQVQQLQKLQEEAAKETPIDIARNQFNETTKILNVATAIYLRLMEDTRKGPAGQLAAEGMKKASAFMESFNPSQQNTAQTTERLINEAVKAGQGTYQELKDLYNKNMPPEFKEMLEKLKEKVSESSNTIDIPSLSKELLEKAKKEAEPMIEKGKEFLRNTFDLNVKVDLNSSSPELADMFVAEVNKNPRLRANLAESILSNKKAFIA